MISLCFERQETSPKADLLPSCSDAQHPCDCPYGGGKRNCVTSASSGDGISWPPSNGRHVTKKPCFSSRSLAHLPFEKGTTGSSQPWESRNSGLVECGAVSADTESISKTPDIATTNWTLGAPASATSIASIAPCEKPTSATIVGP